ncbi:MAG: hypothetical protein AB7U82_04080 [Blastocatellales bacterium]
MNQKTLLVLRVVLGVLGLTIAGIGLRTSANGGQGGTLTWLGIAIVFVSSFLLIARKPKK